MGYFTSQLKFTEIRERRWKLLADLSYKTNSGQIITAPKNFLTDFASVPRFLHWLLRPNGDYKAAAAIHDWLYQNKTELTRQQSDQIFLEAMVSLRIADWKKVLLFSSVRTFGGLAWKGRKD